MSSTWRPIYKLLSGATGGARLSIFIFHRVLLQSDPLFPENPNIERFDALCRFISSAYKVLPLSEAVDRLESNSLGSGCACITFDDGYADNLTLATPILKRWGLTATFFIATGFLEGGRMWNDTLIGALRKCRKPSLPSKVLGLPGISDLSLECDELRRQAIMRLLPVIKYLPHPRRQELVDVLADWVGEQLDDSLMLTHAQLRELASCGMAIGAHTDSHPILSQLDDQTAHKEIRLSRDVLQEVTGGRVDLFAYPNGKFGQDYKQRDADLVKALGFKAAVSTMAGVSTAACDPYHLRRFTPWDTGMHRFALRLAQNYLLKGV